MQSINRTALTLVPKQPYITWANSFEDGEVYSEGEHFASTYLISDDYDEFNYEKYLKKDFAQLFENELEAWMTDPDMWPTNRTYKEFKKWFDVICSDIVWDCGEGDITQEDL